EGNKQVIIFFQIDVCGFSISHTTMHNSLLFNNIDDCGFSYIGFEVTHLVPPYDTAWPFHNFPAPDFNQLYCISTYLEVGKQVYQPT
ncbi:hypothetical protein L195_g061491, partial [Trifolium pratense]